MRIRLKIPNRSSQFFKNYRLPLSSTAGWACLVIVLLLVRAYEQRILAGVLGNSATKQDYATLLSNDEDATLTKNKVSESTNKTEQSNTGAPAPLAIDSSGSSTTGSSSDDSGDSGEDGETPPPAEPPSEPFAAEIKGFALRSQSGTYQCGTGIVGSLTVMCKKYEFMAGVNTYNGPGSVSYKFHWQKANGNAASGDASGSYGAPAGDQLTPISKEIELRCDQPGGRYNFRFLLITPTTAESHVVPVEHNCNATSGP